MESARASAPAIVLTDEQKSALTRLSRSGRTSERLAQRASIVLLAAQGLQTVIDFQERANYMSPMLALARTRLPFLHFADGANTNASFRRSLFDEIGGFEESFVKGSDVEICCRMFVLTQHAIVFDAGAVVARDLKAAIDADIRLMMSIAQRLGKIHGRRWLRRAGIRPTPIEEARVQTFIANAASVSSRIVRG